MHTYTAHTNSQLSVLLPGFGVLGDTGVPGECNFSGRLRATPTPTVSSPEGAQGPLVYPVLQAAVSAPLLQVKPLVSHF